MKSAILISHILIAMMLIGLVLLQNSKGGLGTAFGDGSMYRTKRGAEKIVFYATILVSFLFLVTSLLNMTMQ